MDTTAQEAAEAPAKRRHRARALAVVGLLGIGGVAGGVASAALSAGAASSTTSSASSGASGSGAPSCAPGGGLADSGTVTSVGSASVTIKTSTGTVTYAVSSSSDIDKNGEATLSALAAGDTVHYSTTTSAGTLTIDKLHAGTESLNRPQGPPPGAAAPSAGSGSSSPAA